LGTERGGKKVRRLAVKARRLEGTGSAEGKKPTSAEGGEADVKKEKGDVPSVVTEKKKKRSTKTRSRGKKKGKRVTGGGEPPEHEKEKKAKQLLEKKEEPHPNYDGVKEVRTPNY